MPFFNKALNKEDSYTPFLDSLYRQSATFLYAFANGKKSIDAMPSILASLPRVTTPFSTSKYADNKLSSIASLLSTKGYTGIFSHGAPTGSMGFKSMATLLGFKHYYGMDEYNNDEHYDGVWGIWDHHFMPYFADILTQTKPPFIASIFSVNSHHPFRLPKEMSDRYRDKGTHKNNKVIQYTDESLKEFFATDRKNRLVSRYPLCYHSRSHLYHEI